MDILIKDIVLLMLLWVYFKLYEEFLVTAPELTKEHDEYFWT